MRQILIRIGLITFLFSCCLYAEDYVFKGKHFLASYLDCNPDSLCNVEELIHAMDEAIIASGATILDRNHYIFPPHGLTLVYLLSESHASLHTYPEHGACFVDLFTCGDRCCAIQFDKVLKKYLQPKQATNRLFLRSEEVEEIHFP